jgi:hypothetical protein
MPVLCLLTSDLYGDAAGGGVLPARARRYGDGAGGGVALTE